MSDTKNNVLTEALNLFSVYGFEAVSVKDIADRLGITKSALYKHYKNKNDIFGSIIKQMEALDFESAAESLVPCKAYPDDSLAYSRITYESLSAFTLKQFERWTDDGFSSKFRRMLSIEKYGSKEMAALYSQYLLSGPIAYLSDIFRESFHGCDPEYTAFEFWAPVYYLICDYDTEENKEKSRLLLNKHLGLFKSKLTGENNEIRKK